MVVIPPMRSYHPALVSRAAASRGRLLVVPEDGGVRAGEAGAAEAQVQRAVAVVGMAVHQVDRTQEGVDAGACGRAVDEVVETRLGAGGPDVPRFDPATQVDAA